MTGGRPSYGADGRRSNLSRLHVAIPIRGLGNGKRRLGTAIDNEQRQVLIVGMLLHELAVLLEWSRADCIHVVTPDRKVARIADGAGAKAMLQVDLGLNRAVRAARKVSQSEGATALLVLPGDLPMLDSPALDSLLQAGRASVAARGGAPIVVVASADASGGTNALLCSPVDVIEPQFGPRSLRRHLLAASSAGANSQVIVNRALAFDLDTPADLELLDPARLEMLQALGTRVA